MLESNGSFFKLGQSNTWICLKDGKGKACPYILSSFGRSIKVRYMSLENTLKPDSISVPSLLSSSITFSMIPECSFVDIEVLEHE